MGFFFYNIAYFQKKMEYLPKGLGRGPPQKYAGSSYVQQSYHSSPLRSASPSRPPDSSSWPCGLSLSPQPLVEIQTQQLVNEGATSKAPWGGPDAGPSMPSWEGGQVLPAPKADMCQPLLQATRPSQPCCAIPTCPTRSPFPGKGVSEAGEKPHDQGGPREVT